MPGTMRFIAVLISLALSVAGCGAPKRLSSPTQPVARRQIIDEIKHVERSLGFEETRNFKHGSPGKQAYYRCYFTGKFTLPASYDGLEMREGAQSGCTVDEEKYDVFFYPIEAVSGGAAVTSSLADAPVERLSVVVAHEDFHDDSSMKELPTRVSEAATTLIGFLTAREFARRKFGEASREYGNLSQDVELFLRKARIVNFYHSRLGRLYQSVAARDIGREAALGQKRDLFAQLQQECEEVALRPSSFNPCPAALNNAGLAFDVTYTRYFPLLYELFQAQGADLASTIGALRGELAQKGASEESTVRLLRDLVRRERGRSVSLQ